MSETKDQTISRLEGMLTLANAAKDLSYQELARKEEYAASLMNDLRKATGECHPAACRDEMVWRAELAASQEMGPCGRHPKTFNIFDGLIHGPNGLHRCTICAELAATRAECYKLAACVCENWNEHATGSPADLIRSLVTPSDAAAREEWIRRIRLEERSGLLALVEKWHSEGNPPNCDGHPHVCQPDWLLCMMLAELRAPVPAARAGDANELQYCGRCNQRRHFKDGKCEMCALQDSRDRRINAEDGDHYETERAGDAVCGTCGAGWGDGKNGHPNCPDCHGTGRAKGKS